MYRKYLVIIGFLLIVSLPKVCRGQAEKSKYLQPVILEMEKKWPQNKTINLVFHGHSVPSGYFATPTVCTLEAYPHLLLKELKRRYPFAVINVITTSIGGENSMQGAIRFKKEALIHQPDVVFIDYALNDRSIGLKKSKESIEKMIRWSLKKNIKVILLTPSPDLGVDLLKNDNELKQFAAMLTNLAAKWQIGLADSYFQFEQLAAKGVDLHEYMAQVNHPNEKGHQLIADAIAEYFK